MRQIKISQIPFGSDSNSLILYLKEIRKTKPLNSDEEYKLIKAHRAGDEHALEKIVRANLRFVVSLAKYYQHQGLELSDLINEGNIGLIKAVEKYDETKGFKFISYAIWWIRQCMMNALTENSRIIRLPRYQFASLNKTIQLFKELEQKLEREPTLQELSNLLGIEEDVIKQTLGYEVKHVSIDAPVSIDEAESLLDVIEDRTEQPDPYTDSESLETAIRYLLAGLSENQIQVIEMYYGIGGKERMNLVEIGKLLNVSGERIRQIKDTALKRIKDSDQYSKFEEYMIR